jgi:hypothetical protein
MRKIIVISGFLILSAVKIFSQDKAKIYFRGIADNVIKISQLSDTAIKLVTSVDIESKAIGVEIYYSGEGFSNVQVTTVSLEARLNCIKNRWNIGSSITIGDFVVKNPKTGKNIYIEGCSYKIIAN